MAAPHPSRRLVLASLGALPSLGVWPGLAPGQTADPLDDAFAEADRITQLHALIVARGGRILAPLWARPST